MIIDSAKLGVTVQVRAQLCRAFLLNSALIDEDLEATVDRLTELVLSGCDRRFGQVYSRLQACLIALDEGIKVHSILADRVEVLAEIIKPSVER